MNFNVFSWDHKGGKGPWGSGNGGNGNGRRPNQQSQNKPQPDLDDMLRSAQDHFRRHMGGGKGNGGNGRGGNTGGSQGSPFGGLGFILILVGILWLASGFYIVDQSEEGVVLRFGKYTQTTTPGLNYHLPWPFESVLKPQVERENRVEIGFRDSTMVNGVNRFPRTRGGDMARNIIENESLMLTGDENIVDLNFTVRWKIGNAEDFLFNVSKPEATIKDVSESAMREIIGKRPIDDALTANKAQIELAARDLIQSILDEYGTGVQVNAVELQQVNPPKQVIDAFKDVQAARADAEKAQNEAIGYANDILPKARGQAAQMIQEAEAYKESRVLDAKGQADRFTKQLTEYNKAKDITRQRMYLETMEQVLGKANVVVMGSKSNQNVLPYLPLGQQTQPKQGSR
ncbi:MAG: FtsH protease activity modulator HflK [Magnetococcales bacterium]|nr:FtsH protease activity modulator HflK [Magnetococcales bacterium]